MEAYLTVPLVEELSVRTDSSPQIYKSISESRTGIRGFNEFTSLRSSHAQHGISRSPTDAITTLAYSCWSNRLPRRNYRDSSFEPGAMEFLVSDYVDTSFVPDVSSKLSYCQYELIAWKSQLTERHFKNIKVRLMALIDDVDAMNTDIDMNSFGILLAYLSKHPEFKTPTISYRSNGIFFATWDSGFKSRLTVDFLDDSNVRWVYVNSSDGINKLKTGAGLDDMANLSKVLGIYDIDKWVLL